MKNNVREVRKAKFGISMLELSRLTRISPSDLSLIETDKRIIYYGWKKRISDALNVSVEELFPRNEEGE